MRNKFSTKDLRYRQDVHTMTAFPLVLRRRALVRSRLVTAISVGLSVACGALPEPEVGSPPTGLATELDVLDAAEAAEARSLGAADNTSDQPRSAELIVATGTLVAIGPAAQIRPLGEPFIGIRPSFAVDDFLGGLVAQASDGEVWWFPGEGGTSQLINGDGGTLLGVGLSDSTPFAVLLVEERVNDPAATTEDESTMAVAQRIETVGLVTGARTPFVNIEPGRTVRNFATGGNRSAVIFADASCGGLQLFDEVGVAVPLALPEALCPVASLASFGDVALSPDGAVLAFTQVSYRPDGVEASTSIVGLQLTSASGFEAGTEVFRLDVGGAGDRLSSLAFDGQRLVFIRTSLNPQIESGPMLIDLNEPADAVVLGGADALSVTFARSSLSFG